jgi:hypothetical protein
MILAQFIFPPFQYDFAQRGGSISFSEYHFITNSESNRYFDVPGSIKTGQLALQIFGTILVVGAICVVLRGEK